MLINEIAIADEQIELWKIISNSVWQSLQQQPAPLPTNTINSVKTAGFQPKYGHKKSNDNSDDRHSKIHLPPIVARSPLRR